MWYEAIHWVCWLWGLPGGTRQGQPLLVPCLEAPGISYKVIFRWLVLVLDMDIPRRSQALNLGCLLLVPDLGPLSDKYGWYWGQMLLVCEILRKFAAWAKLGHLYGRATGNGLGGPCKSNGVGFQGINCEHSLVELTLLCWWRLKYCACLLALWGEGSKRKWWPLPALLSGRNLLLQPLSWYSTQLIFSQ